MTLYDRNQTRRRLIEPKLQFTLISTFYNAILIHAGELRNDFITIATEDPILSWSYDFHSLVYSVVELINY